MRTILMLSLLLAVSIGPAVGSPLPGAEAPSEVRITVESLQGVTKLTLRSDGGEPLDAPITRLVALPNGAVDPSAAISAASGDAAASFEVTTGSPMILRGLTVLPVTIAPRPSGESKSGAAALRSIEVEIRYRDHGSDKSMNEASAAPRFSRGFYAPFAPVLSEAQAAGLETTTGSYLIITTPAFAPAIAPFAAWKTEKGFPVTVATTDQTGTTNQQIRDYIARAYQDWSVPPQFVLLVGDVEQIPAFSFHSSTSDHPYSTLDGNDFLPDVSLGRLSARTLQEVETIVAKILRYERDPFVGDDPGWYRRALVVAGDYGSTTPRAVCRWSREQLLLNGYAQVDSCYFPPFFVDYFRTIPNTINAGVSLVSYRGWAYGIHGWEPPHFISSDIPSLTNGWKLPIVFSFVCQNNDFGQGECFGEAWLRAGTAAEPKGAVAFIGNTEPWSHTRFNDACAIGVFNAIRHSGVRRMGDLLNASKQECLVEFPDEIPYLADTDESVEFYYYIYNLLGDPEMEVRMDTPRAVEVSYPLTIPQGANFVDVAVRDAAGQTPLAGVRVGLSQNGALLGCGWTDEAGIARVNASFESTTAPVAIAATGMNVVPFRGTATVFAVESAAFLAFQQVAIDDDNDGQSHGNGDGIPNPGETLELGVALRNRGAQASGLTTADLSAVRGAEIVSGSTTYGGIAPGADGTSAAPFVVRIPATAEDGQVALLRISASPEPPSTLPVSESSMELAVRAPFLRHESSAIAGDGTLDPGATGELTVTLRNDGSVGSSATSAVLTSLTPGLVTVTTPGASFDPIAPSASGVNGTPFGIAAASDAAMGQTAILRLALTTAEGYESSTSFSVTIGTPGHTNPLGPDAYGYYAYDNSDTDYPDSAPLYEWISCSTLYGGSGTKLDLRDNTTAKVTLPFPFTYYGTSYSQILVSDNGWVSFETSSYYDFYNWHMPNTYGNGAQIAPFWDNLDPIRKIDDVPIADGVYVYHDAARHLFVVEWSRMPNSRPELDDLQTFELILYDPAHYATPTGDGIIQCQYKQIVNDDDARMYATVGIENMSEDAGIEYTYANLYPAAAAPISAGLAIRFTTQPPRYSPASLAHFEATPLAPGVRLRWEPADGRPRGGYRIYRASRDGDWTMLTPGALGSAVREFVDESASPDSTYSYRIGSLDPVGRETPLGPFTYTPGGGGGPRFSLEARTPNPFSNSVTLAYGLARGGAISLQIHDLAGRLVRELVGGRHDAGSWTASWDGLDAQGRELPSGVYLCTLSMRSERRTVKLTLLR